ncbi:hypothetical protein EPUS_01974 [Endocarpon pusillum Z07020]|uniref:Uncharacterized protein n=1 Tax=Endocarpon pusillum (strain Z07020 / HMAS-L-300199) TaxID=1263415 RepID=U1G9W5_ENDPU|nr:uncharacterized protein EPUS_01974 [Endocarpon pusillum Z07020]ERF74287.1 hypothetical protein EPUS_01974 [Endocarpon pusillum Z07020]
MVSFLLPLTNAQNPAQPLTTTPNHPVPAHSAAILAPYNHLQHHHPHHQKLLLIYEQPPQGDGVGWGGGRWGARGDGGQGGDGEVVIFFSPEVV